MSVAVEVAVVGGGIAGLAAGLRLAERGLDVHVYEAAARAGGFVSSVRRDGYLIEEGPASMRGDRFAFRSVIDVLGLAGEVALADAAAKDRYVFAAGRLIKLPGKPPELVKSPILSARGKLRLMREPFVPPRTDAGAADETLAELFARRLGPEAVANLVDPFVTGILAGDPARLGLDALPGLATVERMHKSFFGAMRARGGLGGGGGLYSLREGLGQAPAAIARRLGERLHLGVRIARMALRDERVVLEPEVGETIVARRVILATPAADAGRLLRSTIAGGEVLTALEHAPITRVEVGLAHGTLRRPLEGFGILCANASPLPGGAGPVMGIVFSSSVFPGRAPAGHRSLSVMLGGVRDRGIVERDDTAVRAQALGAIDALLGLGGEPAMMHVTRWARAIPQYAPGHARRIAALVGGLPGRVVLAGNYLDGVSLDQACASGLAAADVTTARLFGIGAS